jgi:hypothetical protein
MGQPIPAQHPSVVLRSHFKLVRTLLILAMGALVALAAAVVILANDDDKVDTASKATPAVQAQAPTQAGIRFDGGPEEGTRGLAAERQLPVGTRFDGGPEEGTRGATVASATKASPAVQQPQTSAGVRFDGGPEEGTRGPVRIQFKERAGGPSSLVPQGPAGR